MSSHDISDLISPKANNGLLQPDCNIITNTSTSWRHQQVLVPQTIVQSLVKFDSKWRPHYTRRID